LEEIAAIMGPYGVDTVVTDQYSIDAMSDLADTFGISLLEHTTTGENRLKMMEEVAFALRQNALELPPGPPEFRSDLIQVRKRVTVNGVTLVLPISGGGRHCDFAPSLALSLVHPPSLPEDEPEDVDEDLQRELDRFNSRGKGFWDKLAIRHG
jgi:hypothetical protein